MESLSIQDKMLWDLKQGSKGLNSICEIINSIILSRTLKKLVKKYASDKLSSLKDKTRFTEDPMKSYSILDKILRDQRQDPTKSYKILQDRRKSF